MISVPLKSKYFAVTKISLLSVRLDPFAPADVLVDTHCGNHPIGGGNDGLLDVGTQQIAHGKYAGDGGLQDPIHHQTAFRGGFKPAIK